MCDQGQFDVLCIGKGVEARRGGGGAGGLRGNIMVAPCHPCVACVWYLAAVGSSCFRTRCLSRASAFFCVDHKTVRYRWWRCVVEFFFCSNNLYSAHKCGSDEQIDGCRLIKTVHGS